jgi:hypothetical protein
MDFPQIRINSTKGKIGLQTTKPIQEIQQAPAELTIQQPKAELEIDRTPSRLTIDQTKAWEDMDLKHISRRIEEFAQNGYQDWLEGLARVSSQGDELMMIEHGGTPLADQAETNSLTMQHEFGLGWIPSHFSVKIDYKPTQLDINWKTHEPNINVEINKPIHNYTRGKVETYLKQRPELAIDFVGGKINQEI